MASKLTEYASTRLAPGTLSRIKQIAQRKEWSLSKTIAKLIEKGLAKAR